MRAASLLLRTINLIEGVTASLAYALVAGLLIGDVFGRELFGAGIFGAQKMAVFAAIVAGFLGLALATAANAQLRPTFLDHLFKGPLVDRLGDGMSAAFYLFLAYVAAIFIGQSMEFQDRAAVLYWLLWPIQLIIPYALTSTALRHGIFAAWPDLKPKAGGAV